ncbi:MAG: hypothetical protein ACKOA4_09415 [Haliscomenobacter sp.]
MNRLIWPGVLLLQCIFAFPAQAREADAAVAQFLKPGLHVDLHHSFYQSPLLEIVEVNENESSPCEDDGGEGNPGGQFVLPESYVLPALNPVNLQRLHLLLYRIHGNFRL